MAIAFKGAGTGAATANTNQDLTPTFPATVDANDIAIVHVAYQDLTFTPAPPGFTLLGGPFDIGTAGNGHHWIFGKICDGSEDGATLTIPAHGVVFTRVARIYTYSGYVSGAISDVIPAASFNSTTHATDPQGPTVTTTVAGALAIAAVFQTDNNTISTIVGATGGTWAESIAEYLSSTPSPGVMMQVEHCTPTGDPGTVSGGAASTANDPCGVIGFQIRPSPGATNITPSGIAHTRGQGSPTVNPKLFPTGLSHTRAQGAPTVKPKIFPAGIAHTRALGSPAVSAITTISPTGLTRTRALGSETISPSASPTGLAHTRAQGAPTVANITFLSPAAIAHTRGQGAATVSPQAVLTGLAHTRALGAQTANVDVGAVGLAHTRGQGAPTVNVVVFPGSLTHDRQLGGPVVPGAPVFSSSRMLFGLGV